MKTIATMDPASASVLAAFLQKEGVVCETRAGTDENGLDTVEILVPDDRYDAACEATDKWDAEMTALSEKANRRRCPTCDSPHVEFVKDFDYEKSLTKITAVYQCQDCGRVFTPRY